MYFVRAVGEPERARARPQVGQREVLAYPSPAVGLDRLVDHPLGHGRGYDLDRLDLGVRALVAHGVHQPRGLQHEQPGLLDPDPGLGDPVLDDALLGQRLAERGPGQGPGTHELQGLLGGSDHPHAMVDAPGSQPRLRDREPLALARDEVFLGDVHVGEVDLGVAAVRPFGVAEHPQAAPDIDPRGITGHQDHGVPSVTGSISGDGLAGHPHHDEDLAVRAHRARRPPLAAVDHVAVARLADRGGDVRRVTGGDGGLGHAERRPDLPVEQRAEPALLLFRRAELGQHLHVAGVGRSAVQRFGRQRRAPAGDLGQRRVLQVGQRRVRQERRVQRADRLGGLAGQEEVPQTAPAGLGLEVGGDGQALPGAARGLGRLGLLPEGRLGRIHLLIHERGQAFTEVLRPVVVSEIHGAQPPIRSRNSLPTNQYVFRGGSPAACRTR